MSSYTTQVRHICETAAGVEGGYGQADVGSIIEKAVPKIFDFPFPMHDESYRNVLCTKILKHYYTREIAAETVGLWKLWLETRMNEIMPYYNQLYASELIKFNPMIETDYKREYTKDGNGATSGTGKSVSSNSSEGWEKYSDTPQGYLTNVENGDYLTTATNNTANSSTNANHDESSKFNNTEAYLEHIVGKTSGKGYSKLLSEFRSTFINIDTMIINELSDLFFALW